MTIDELAQLLEDCREQGLSGQTQVIIGDQPNYPFGCSISTYCIDETFEPRLQFGRDRDVEPVLVLCEGSQLGYGNKAWWDGEDIRAEDEEQEWDGGRHSCEAQSDNFGE